MNDYTFPTFGLEWDSELEVGILQNLDSFSCVEIIPENFFNGKNHSFLRELRTRDIPVAVHGVELSLGSCERLKEFHFNRVIEVMELIRPINFSEHLALTEVRGVGLDALTPLALTEEVLRNVCDKIDFIQNRIGVPFLVENISNRFCPPAFEYSECGFINEVVKRTGCGLLLDVTNVWTNSVNFQFDPFRWLEEISLEKVGLIHLAGGNLDPDGFLMDSHDNSIPEEVWKLFEYICCQIVPPITIIERTGNYPAFEELLSELRRAKSIVGGSKYSKPVSQFQVPLY